MLGNPSVAPGVSRAVGTPSTRADVPRATASALSAQKSSKGCWALAAKSLLPSARWMSALNFMVFNASFKKCD